MNLHSAMLDFCATVVISSQGKSAFLATIVKFVLWALFHSFNFKLLLIVCCVLLIAERIALNRKRIACPMIDVISNEDFHYATQAGDVMRGAFDWELYYKRIPINEAEMKRRKQDTDPVRYVIQKVVKK